MTQLQVGNVIKNLYPVRFFTSVYPDDVKCIKDLIIIDYSTDENNNLTVNYYYEKLFTTLKGREYIYPKYPNYTSNGILNYQIVNMQDTIKLNEYLNEGFPRFYGDDPTTAFSAWLASLTPAIVGSTKTVVTANKVHTYPIYTVGPNPSTGEMGYNISTVTINVTKTVYETGTVNCPCIEIPANQLTGTVTKVDLDNPDGQKFVLGNWNSSLLTHSNYVFPLDTDISINVENKPAVSKYYSKFNIWDYLGSNGEVVLKTPDNKDPIIEMQSKYTEYKIPIWGIL